MFELQTPNISFKHLDTFSKGYWGQRSPEVIQGHQGSLSFKKKKKLQYLTTFYIFEKPESCNINL